jgi:hypothetical protein
MQSWADLSKDIDVISGITNSLKSALNSLEPALAKEIKIWKGKDALSAQENREKRRLGKIRDWREQQEMERRPIDDKN